MVELIWDGKYTPDGRKSAPVRLALPFQDIETVNESAQQRQLMLDLWSTNRSSEWRNRLIWGDKRYVLPSLLPEFAGKVNLVYIDPPFATGDNFSFTASIPDDPDTDGEQGGTFTKQPSMIEQKAYRDTWGRGLDSYLQWFYETIVVLYELLAETGSLYIHLDDNVGYYAKAVLDEVFGAENFINDIVWKRSNPHNDTKRYGSIHDIILFYAKSPNYQFATQYTPPSKDYIGSHFTSTDTDGRHFTLMPLMASGAGPARRFGDKVLTPPAGTHWRWTQERIDEGMKSGLIVITSGGTPRYKFYADDSKGRPLQTVWTDIVPINSQSAERESYPTQKPEALLERIINTSSNEGDLVLDCFCGSGTTAAVAEKLGRRWITADLGRFAIHTARKRLLSIPDVRPFVVQNLGKYERQAWQSAEFGQAKEKAALAQAAYRRFILDLYGAEPLDGYAWLHGVKAGRFVHVGSVDAPITDGDIRAIAREFWKAVGKETGAATNTVDILGWDFAFELNEMGKQLAAEANIKLSYKKIPREVLEKKAVEQGDIKFFELAALSVEVLAGKGQSGTQSAQSTHGVTVELCDFIVPPDDVPQDVQKAVTHWSQFIDYWAVDWDYRGDTFHNQWQSYRTKKQPKLQLSVAHAYDAPGTYTIVIKVIDILGNDTTKSVTVEVA